MKICYTFYTGEVYEKQKTINSYVTTFYIYCYAYFKRK